nr:hypothetical protein Iba_chr12fCG12610 [Ipomoea batatas]
MTSAQEETRQSNPPELSDAILRRFLDDLRHCGFTVPSVSLLETGTVTGVNPPVATHSPSTTLESRDHHQGPASMASQPVMIDHSVAAITIPPPFIFTSAQGDAQNYDGVTGVAPRVSTVRTAMVDDVEGGVELALCGQTWQSDGLPNGVAVSNSRERQPLNMDGTLPFNNAIGSGNATVGSQNGNNLTFNFSSSPTTLPITGTIHNANNLLSAAHGDIANVSTFPITNNSTSTTVHGVSNVALTGNGLNNVVSNVHGLNNLPTVHNLGSLNNTNVGTTLHRVDNANTANNLPSATRGGSTKNN